MAPRVSKRNIVGPRRRLGTTSGYFFVGEVVRLLKLDGLDYAQIKRLVDIAVPRRRSATTERKWTRFTFQDLIAMRVAFELAGGHEALAAKQRLRLKQVADACNRLRDQYGLKNPLTEARLKLDENRRVVATVKGVHFEPATGQTVIADLEDRCGSYLKKSCGRRERTKLQSVMKDELRSLPSTPAELAPACRSSVKTTLKL